MFRQRFLSYGRPILHHFKSSVWLGVREHISTVIVHSLWLIGDGSQINFLIDNWLGTPLATIFNISHSRQLICTLSDFIIDGKLQLPGCFLMNPLVEASVQNIVLPVSPLSDQRVWPLSKDGKLSAKSAFLFLHGLLPSLVWPGLVWRPCIPPSHSFTFWRLMHGKLPIDENLQCQGFTLVSICVLCYVNVKTSVHLFLECDFALHLWR